MHVTLRCRAHVWNLRSQRCFAVVERALRAIREREGFRVVQFSMQGNHLHLVVEAAGATSLARGIQALSIRLARGLNRVMSRSGPVFSDRYHAHVLRTPAETRRALCYVLQNFRRHAAQRGERLPPAWLDPYSSASTFDGWRNAAPDPGHDRERLTSLARTWLLDVGWRRGGLIATDETPPVTTLSTRVRAGRAASSARPRPRCA